MSPRRGAQASDRHAAWRGRIQQELRQVHGRAVRAGDLGDDAGAGIAQLPHERGQVAALGRGVAGEHELDAARDRIKLVMVPRPDADNGRG